MRSRAVTALTVIGVLGAGSAAMAINADTFASGPGPIGTTSSVLVPQADELPSPSPSAAPTSEPAEDKTDEAGDSQGVQPTGKIQAPAPVFRQPVASTPKSAPKPSKPSAPKSPTVTHHETEDHESDDHETEDHESDDHETEDHTEDHAEDEEDD